VSVKLSNGCVNSTASTAPTTIPSTPPISDVITAS
jgi:hypothetical protein